MLKKSGYIKKWFDIFINLTYIITLLGVLFLFAYLFRLLLIRIPNITNFLGNIISGAISIGLAVVSYFTKIKSYLIDLLYKIKRIIYLFVSCVLRSHSSCFTSNFNMQKLTMKSEQVNIINSSIKILKNNKQDLLMIYGIQGIGKTSTISFLLDVISKDKELYRLFATLNRKITYYDIISDLDKISYNFSHPEKQSSQLIIIDNIQKIALDLLEQEIKRIKSLINYFEENDKPVLVMLLYKSNDNYYANFEYIREKYFNENNIFKLEESLSYNTKHYSKNNDLIYDKFNTNFKVLTDDFLYYHFFNFLFACKDKKIISFFDSILFEIEKDYNKNELKWIEALCIILYMSCYYGYFTKKEIRLLCEKEYFSIISLYFIINKLNKYNFIIQFPLLPSTFLLNDSLAKQYRKILSSKKVFLNKFSSIAEKLYGITPDDSDGLKWLLFVSCSCEFCVNYPQKKRIAYFKDTLNNFNINYICEILEYEIDIYPEKENIFRPELGIIYIRNGNWKTAKEILYPYIDIHNFNRDIWYIQLQIIEAEHGCEDNNYLDMLNCMKNECTDPIVQIQIDYWLSHIFMEKGKFDLNIWCDLVNRLKNNKYLSLIRDEHFSTRVIADYERTYFLNGKIDYQEYQKIINNYDCLNKGNKKSIEKQLSRAYYIQYDIIPQLGLWGFFKNQNIDNEIIRKPVNSSNNIISELISEALNIYDICIEEYKCLGKKKFRTLQIRRAELTLYMNVEQYVNTLNVYDNFMRYATRNDVAVFQGFCDTQKGKAYALYAISELHKGNMDLFEYLLDESIASLEQAKSIYNKYENVYGEYRASLLLTLVGMIKKRNNCNAITFETYYTNEFLKLKKTYDKNQVYFRENDIIEYVVNNIKRLNTPVKAIRYYPIILQ